MGQVLAMPGPIPAARLAELIERARAGDVAAFERLIAAHHDNVYAFALTFTGDTEAAKDLAQEALVKVYRALDGFRSQSAFSTWLYAIVRNTYLDHEKSRGGRQRRSEQPLDEATLSALRQEATAEDELLAHESRRGLLTALEQVAEPFRTAVLLADVQGLEMGEIADMLGVPQGTIKSRLARGRIALRAVLFGRKREEEP
jgi:RNA polymerase sigma-70 factor (ECF subfamily)